MSDLLEMILWIALIWVIVLLLQGKIPNGCSSKWNSDGISVQTETTDAPVKFRLKNWD